MLWMYLIIVPLILGSLYVNMIGVAVAQETHDIAVASVAPSPTLVRLDELVNITVVVENKGTENETFDVIVYYGTSIIGTKTVQNLTAGADTSIAFIWNTTDVREEIYAAVKKEKYYFINATASTVPGETDTGDNTLLSPDPVKVVSRYIAVVPQSIVDSNMTLSKNFTVSIYTDYNGSDITSYQFGLSYNPNVLHVVEVTNGDLITTDKNSSATFEPGPFNNTAGRLLLTKGYFFYPPLPVPTTSGPGILATVTFTIVGTGDSNIILDANPVDIRREATLYGWTEGGYGEKYTIIDYREPAMDHILDGFFQNIEVVKHDIVVVSVTPFPTSVEKGELVNISVTVKNNGTVNEDVTVQVWNGKPGFSKLIGTKTVSNLGAGASTSLTFTWDTTDVVADDYTMAAVASVPGDTHTLESEEIVTVRVRQEQPIPLVLIIGVAAVVVIVLVIVVYVVRRK